MKFAIVLGAALFAVGCGGTDPCAGHSGTCVSLEVQGEDIGTIDVLQIAASGAASGTQVSTGKNTKLPVRLALLWPSGVAGTVHLDVEGLSGTQVLGAGSTDAMLVDGKHTSATVVLTSGSGPDLSITDLGSDMTNNNDDMTHECMPSCASTTTLDSCGDGGVISTTCPLGCVTTGEAHCATVVPTAPVPQSDLYLDGVTMDVVTAATSPWVFNTDTGAITHTTTLSIRTPNTVPANLEINDGVGFHVVNGVGIFIFNSLTVPASATAIALGTNAAALVTKGDARIDGILDARAYDAALTLCATTTAGPGGGAGGHAGYRGMGLADGGAKGAGMGGGIGGGDSLGDGGKEGGGGGAGHGDTGGESGDPVNSLPGGAGVAYDTVSTGYQGGSGGGGGGIGASNTAFTDGPFGGGGGGAVRIIAGGTIKIGTAATPGGINAGGCGGIASSVGGGGGSGGFILLEATAMQLSAHGVLAANGGAGGDDDGATAGGNGTLDSNPAVAAGSAGNGGAGPTCQGTAGTTAGNGGGGGAAGFIRINTIPANTVTDPAFVYSPTLTSGCASTGTATTE